MHVCHLLPTAISFPRGFSYVPQKEEKAKPLFFSKSSFFPSQKKKGNQSNVTFKTQGGGGLKKILICLRPRTEIGFLKDEAQKVVLVL